MAPSRGPHKATGSAGRYLLYGIVPWIHGSAREYQIGYDAKSEAAHDLRDALMDRLNPGEGALRLRASAKNELFVEDGGPDGTRG